MSGGAAPLRFLGIVLGGWVCARTALLMPGAPEQKVEPIRLIAPASAANAARLTNPIAPLGTGPVAIVRPPKLPLLGKPVPLKAAAPSPTILAAARSWTASSPNRSQTKGAVPAPFPSPIFPAPALIPRTNRWSLSGWAFFREGGGRQLATGGTLGGSQAGARISFALGSNLAVSGRFYSPLHSRGAEAALGLEWQPSRAIPMRFLAERRQSLGSGGRSAFAVMAHGGLSEVPLAGPFRLDAYGQAGVVGVGSRDLFVDGAVRAGVPIAGNLSAGVGLWGAAQPGVSRLDVGPQVSFRFPVEGVNLRISAEWRQRIAGDAAPGSGPALTLSTDF